MSSASDQLLAVDGLRVDRGGRTVLADLSFTLARGEIILVSGRNGAGKSTLLRTLSGLIAPAEGHIRFALANEDRRGVETVHYLGYEDALKPALTVRENLAFWAALLASGAPDVGARAIPDALDAYGVRRLLDLPTAYLSAGQKRRVALARLLLAPRPIWLLDEPLIALDTGAQARTTQLMGEHAAKGGAILVASHQPLEGVTRTIDLDRERSV